MVTTPKKAPAARKPRAKKSETPKPSTSTVSSYFNKASASLLNSPATYEKPGKTPKIPDTKQTIPQREKDLAKVAEDRKKAVETFKKLQDSKKSKK